MSACPPLSEANGHVRPSAPPLGSGHGQPAPHNQGEVPSALVALDSGSVGTAAHVGQPLSEPAIRCPLCDQLVTTGDADLLFQALSVTAHHTAARQVAS